MNSPIFLATLNISSDFMWFLPEHKAICYTCVECLWEKAVFIATIDDTTSVFLGKSKQLCATFMYPSVLQI